MCQFTKIDLKHAQVIKRTREVISELVFGWEMGYDEGEIRDEVRLVKSLLDLLWATMPEGIEEQRKHEEAMRAHYAAAKKASDERAKKKTKKKEAK